MQPTQYAIRYTIYDIRYTSYANRLSSPTCRGVAFSEAGISTTVEDSLQISSFMQNKANLLDAQMNVTKVLTKEYENIANCKLCENKANSKPIQTQTKPIKANFPAPRGETNPIQTQSKPIKPNFTPESLHALGRDPVIYVPIRHLQQRAKKCLLKISCLMAQGFLCWGHGFFMLWIKKEYFGENVQ